MPTRFCHLGMEFNLGTGFLWSYINGSGTVYMQNNAAFLSMRNRFSKMVLVNRFFPLLQHSHYSITKCLQFTPRVSLLQLYNLVASLLLNIYLTECLPSIFVSLFIQNIPQTN